MHDFDRLADYLRQNSGYTREEIELVCSCFNLEQFRPETSIFTNGQRYEKLIFVTSGILRVFIVDENGEEIVKNFVSEGEFFADMRLFDANYRTNLNLSSITACKFLSLSKAASEIISGRIESWAGDMRNSALKATTEMIVRQNFLRIGDSSEQYRWFVKHYPREAQLVPLKYIASFLRITQSSLSRIRRQQG